MDDSKQLTEWQKAQVAQGYAHTTFLEDGRVVFIPHASGASDGDENDGDQGSTGDDEGTGDDQGSGAGAGDDGSDEQGSTQTYDADYVKKLRNEAASYRKRAQTAEGRVKEFEDEQLTERQKAERDATEARDRAAAAEARAQKALGRSAVVTAAVRAGAVDPDTVYALVQTDVTFDDDGEPENVDELVTGLLAAKPFLAGSADGGSREGSGGGSGNGRRSGGPLTAAHIRKMTQAEVNALDPAEVDAALARA